MAIDKAEWQYDSAMKEYCEATGKKQEELTSADEEEKDLREVKEQKNQYLNDFGTAMDGKILCVSFSWDDYLKVEPLIDAAYSGELI